jgi:Tfp pilus assembly protein PilO
MSSSNRLIVSILGIAGLAIAFWMLALSPKREEANELSAQASELQASLSAAQAKVTEAVAAKQEFPSDYRQLVVLGKAAPAGEETASLLVELSQVAKDAGVKFESIALGSEGETVEAAPPVAAAPTTSAAGSEVAGVPAASTVPPTEAAASLMPLGASIGPAGLAVMPYNLTFTGNFFKIADFIKGIDSLVGTGNSRVAVDGRLLTLDGFALNAAGDGGFPRLAATFAVTTYVTPPNQGLTAGATPATPAPSVATPASATAGSASAVPTSDASGEEGAAQ